MIYKINLRGKYMVSKEKGYYHQQLDQIAQLLSEESSHESLDWFNVRQIRNRLNYLIRNAILMRESSGYKSDWVHAVAVEPLANYKLRLILSDGRRGTFDVAPLIDRGVFQELKDPEYFRQVYVDDDTIRWPHEQDIAPETIETDLQPERMEGER
jgi:hypothetical protein